MDEQLYTSYRVQEKAFACFPSKRSVESGNKLRIAINQHFCPSPSIENMGRERMKEGGGQRQEEMGTKNEERKRKKAFDVHDVQKEKQRGDGHR